MKKLVQILLAVVLIVTSVVVGIKVNNANKGKGQPLDIQVEVEDGVISLSTSSDIELHEKPYSFDAGITWQAENTLTVENERVWGPGTLLIRDSAGNTAANKEEVRVLPPTSSGGTPQSGTSESADTTKPEMDITVRANVVTITATDDVALHERAYSFNGGSTWQVGNTYTVINTYTWRVGSICVRDAAGNITTNGQEVTATYVNPNGTTSVPQEQTPPPSPGTQDTEAPVLSVSVSGATVTATATDNVGLHAQAYSFDNGATWQAGNTFTVSATHTWRPGEIKVRDAAGNITSSVISVTATPQVTSTPSSSSSSTSSTSTSTSSTPSSSSSSSSSTSTSSTPSSSSSSTSSTSTSSTPSSSSSGTSTTSTTSTPSSSSSSTSSTSTTSTPSSSSSSSSSASTTSTPSSSSSSSSTTSTSSTPSSSSSSSSSTSTTSTPSSSSSSSSEPQQDNTAPTMQVSVNGAVVTVTATDDVALHTTAYSFDNGTTWQATNTVTVTVDTTWQIGEIKVRDAAGNVASNTEVVVAIVPDTTPPRMIIGVSDSTLTITATDNVALHEQAYSFDNGTTWQEENTVTVTVDTIWQIGEIQVRDAAGNVARNSFAIMVSAPDTTPPTFTVVVEYSTLTILAQDNIGLHTIAYSFDGGDTWQERNFVRVTESTTWQAGEIQVRDMEGNIAYSTEPVMAEPVDDVVPPEIQEIKVEGATVTVIATDETALHDTAYSFNGGWSWQAGNTLTVGEQVIWQVGGIQVRDTAGNIAFNSEVITANPAGQEKEDKKPPEIEEITVFNGVVTITAKDDVALHAEPYSFDNGVTWQAENTFTVTVVTTWQAGEIQVRDAEGNITVSEEEITAIPADTEVPTFTTSVEGATLTVNATDDVALHAEAYSFNGGWSWQAENSVTVTETYTWPAGSICVRDAVDNISYNTADVTIVIEAEEDTTPPVIENIEVDGLTVTIIATDDVALHAQPYSFDSGVTWQTSNRFEGMYSYTWQVREIQVRDARGNISFNTEVIVMMEDDGSSVVESEPESSVPESSSSESSQSESSQSESSSSESSTDSSTTDTTPPSISIQVNGATVTITATDDVALHSLPYSFNGGDSWSMVNSITVTQATVWQVGEIQVKDAAGNIASNTEVITAQPPTPLDTTPPEIEIVVQPGQVIILATDNIALHETAYSFDGGQTWQESYIYILLEARTWQAGEIQVRDAAGNTTTNTEVITAQMPDTTPPQINIRVQENTVTVEAQDDVALHETAYSFDGGQTWQAENTVTVSEDTTWQAGAIQVRDAAGNITQNAEPVTALIADTTPPEIYISVVNNTITITAQDNKALHETAYSFDGGVTWQATNSKTLTEDTVWQIGEIQVRDAVGNISSNTEVVRLTMPDTAPPEVDFVQTNGVLTLVATDNIALHSEPYSFDNGVTWQANNTYTVLLTEIRTWQIGEIQIRDAVGNITSNPVVITLACVDLTPPVIHTIEVYNGEVVVIASDDINLHTTPYSFDGGQTWVAGNTFIVSVRTVWQPGQIIVRDAAGNTVANANVITALPPVDMVLPQMQISVSSLQYTTSKTLTVTATDNEALHPEAYSFDGGQTWRSTNTVTVATTTTWQTGQIQVRDAAGNINSNTTPIVVDRFIKIERVTNTTKKITLIASDNGNGQPPQRFSFDNGATWQSSNSFIVTTSRTWQVGTIKVESAGGSINTNGEAISVSVMYYGIDVSAHQGNIDWAAVRASGVDFAVIRAVTWSSTNNYWIEDPFFEYNVKAAKANGIEVGAYIYTYAYNETEIIQELAVYEAAAQRLANQGYTLDLPVYVDHEYNGLLTAISSVGERTRLLKFEMDILFQKGYYSGFYTYTNWALNNINAGSLQAQGYDFWVADYRGYNGYGSATMWQYSSTASVPGISTNVDVNYLYRSYGGTINGSNNAGQPVGERTFTVFDQNTGQTVTATRQEILAAIVNNEVGNTHLTGMDRKKLFQAQAVAAHSWLLFHYENQNSTPRVGLKWDGNYNTVYSNISDVINSVVTYNGAVANTVYTSTGNGYTNSAQSYWGTDVPYLRSVESPDSYNYGSHYQNITMTRNTETVKQNLIAVVGGDYSAGIAPENWIVITSRDSVGYVTGIRVWGRDVPVSTFYEKVVGPYSPAFTYTYSNGQFTFTASGYGHGVGMSQYGAMGLIAERFYNWMDVLNHYYRGTTIIQIS